MTQESSNLLNPMDVLITVVTPVYNQAATLRETIDSVLAQTYRHIEYIVINDGSFDETESLLREYKDRIRIISQENRGQSAALNRAWNEASGDYLTYLSADDILYPDCIETLVEAIDGDAVVYYPDFDLIDVRSEKVRTERTPDYDIEDLTCGLICQPGLAALFRTDAYRAVGGWDSSYRFIPDFEFWTRMAFQGEFKRIPKVVGGFRIHDESGSVRSISSVASDEIIRFVDEFTRFPSISGKKRAIFQSRLMSARSHFQSRRLITGLQRYIQAFVSCPLAAIKPTNIKFVISGLVRRTYYRFKTFFSKRR
ncbi:MAG: glycosyltransferase [Endozoicomonas sp. (ex Botrylloides leachii)]|nr:glycosyltransferase [Endozoicomonas sp. (ex Botrylloides leachii)]